jgi:hypothetical protein
MNDIEPGLVRLSEYRAPSHRITDVDSLDIREGAAIVSSKLRVIAMTGETTLGSTRAARPHLRRRMVGPCLAKSINGVRR